MVQVAHSNFGLRDTGVTSKVNGVFMLNYGLYTPRNRLMRGYIKVITLHLLVYP